MENTWFIAILGGFVGGILAACFILLIPTLFLIWVYFNTPSVEEIWPASLADRILDKVHPATYVFEYTGEYDYVETIPLVIKDTGQYLTHAVFTSNCGANSNEFLILSLNSKFGTQTPRILFVPEVYALLDDDFRAADKIVHVIPGKKASLTIKDIQIDIQILDEIPRTKGKPGFNYLKVQTNFSLVDKDT